MQSLELYSETRYIPPFNSSGNSYLTICKVLPQTQQSILSTYIFYKYHFAILTYLSVKFHSKEKVNLVNLATIKAILKDNKVFFSLFLSQSKLLSVNLPAVMVYKIIVIDGPITSTMELDFFNFLFAKAFMVWARSGPLSLLSIFKFHLIGTQHENTCMA